MKKLAYALTGVLLSVGAANAETYTFTGTGYQVDSSQCSQFSGTGISYVPCTIRGSGPTTISGTLDVENGILVGATGVWAVTSDGYNVSFSQGPLGAEYSVMQHDDFQEYSLNIIFDLTTGLLTFNSFEIQDWYPNYLMLSTSGTGSFTVTPLPGALPLFGTALGALGLLGWRRRRKNA